MNVKAIQTFAGLICALVTITAGGAVAPKANLSILPPHADPTGCCTFETGICGFNSPTGNWFWSRTAPPPTTPVPAHDGYYLWSYYSNSSLLTNHIANFSSSTPFSMDYYISDPGIQVDFYFHMGSPITTVFVGNLTYSPGIWSTDPRTCADCCGAQSTCDGYFEIRIPTTTTQFIMAVDNPQINGSC